MKSEINVGRKVNLTDLTAEEREVFRLSERVLTEIAETINSYIDNIEGENLKCAFAVSVTTNLLENALSSLEDLYAGPEIDPDKLLHFRRLAIEKLQRGLKK